MKHQVLANDDDDDNDDDRQINRQIDRKRPRRLKKDTDNDKGRGTQYLSIQSMMNTKYIELKVISIDTTTTPNQTSNDMGVFAFQNIVPSSSLPIIIIASLASVAATETICHI